MRGSELAGQRRRSQAERRERQARERQAPAWRVYTHQGFGDHSTRQAGAWRSREATPVSLRAQKLVHHFSVNVGQAEVAALESVSQPGVIDAETVQNRRVQIVNVHRIARDVVAEVVRLADRHARLDAAARQPHREAARMMIAPVIRPPSACPDE